VTARARAFWVREPGRGEIRTTPLPPAAPGEVLVRTLYSAVSRGTESVVFTGRVPSGLRDVMRAPFQEGDFPGPVKYGYLNVGVVETGPQDLAGRTVFCLYPHQTRYLAPASAVVPVPEVGPAGRAVLAGVMETAVNALWDAPPLVGDRVAVVGGGLVGCCVAAVVGRIPGVRVQLLDTDPSRAPVAAALGVEFALPSNATGNCDLVVHASATSAGLATSLELAAPDATVVELSWYGDRPVEVPLGEVFHPRRLVLRSSQVGSVAPARRDRRSRSERLALALELLADPSLDTLITGESDFADLPEVLPRLVSGELPAICHRIRYPLCGDQGKSRDHGSEP
jgi:threonine dehydrogenase-like Zn-dependent dehydrogenase